MGKFGIYPKLALLAIMLIFLGSKIYTGYNDRKADSKLAKIELVTPGQYENHAQTQPLLAQAPDSTGTSNVADSSGGLAGFLKSNWAALVGLLIALLEGITRLTPSERDNSVINFLKYLIDAIIPNRREGGGVHG